MKSLLLLAALLGIAFAYSTLEYEQEFTNWMQNHGKIYTHDEFHSRFDAFKFNMDYVRDWNNKNSKTTLGLTIFADLTNEEYRKIYLGTHIHVSNVPTEQVASNVALPDSVDWRKEGAVTPVKDQGQCGSCWAFSAVGSTEAAHFFSSGNLVSLSEQNLMDCSSSYGNQGCNGGLMDSAFKYIIANKGIDTEASYPYTAQQGTCQFSRANVGATLSKYTDVKSGSETALQSAAVNAPVSVAIDASQPSFQLYQSGVYNETNCSSTRLDHGVLVVGYGADASGNTYWIVKNSWGTTWGMLGYIQMSRGENNQCGIATAASYPTA